MANRIGPMDPGAIGKLGNKVGETGTTRKPSGDQRAADAETSTPATSSDTVNLTNRAKLLERLDASLAAVPDIDSARVDEIKAAIASGDYEIDADAIASAMLRLERELGD